MHDEVNVGLATATPDGLIVPVVKRADTLDLAQLAAEVDRVSSAAREGKTAVSDVQGGTITISNTGAWRGGHGTSLIVPPEVAIVGFGRIEEKAVVRDGKGVLPNVSTDRIIDSNHIALDIGRLVSHRPEALDN